MLRVSIQRTVGIDTGLLKSDKKAEAYYVVQIKNKLREVQCPVHGTRPYIHLLPEFGGYAVSLENECCQAFSDLCLQKLH
jgi:hypothetical protein